ncbi:uncharacterized protein LOC132613236 [Lycium barbarum]|uniref:uncharacterized protein LOC132613236 n=1 Tax=Lycium barbarum TaxID=112863 RepID=UPI00293E23B4|nr:uncharacterized protein LOC132613236 [Lycium barbarum]
MGRMAIMQNVRPHGALLSDAEKNSKDCKAVTLRNGRELEEVHINIPLVELLQEVAKYEKYIKEVVANKRRWTEFETVPFTKKCNSRVRSKIPPKLKDPGSFTISINIVNIKVGLELCDLGASINLMPTFVFRTLGLGEPRPMTITLQLADQSLAYLDGIIEDVLVKMSMTVDGQEATFDVFKATKLPAYYEELKMIIVVEPELTNAGLDHFLASRDLLETALVYGEDFMIDAEIKECLSILDTSCSYLQANTPFEELDKPESWKKQKPSIEEAPVLKLNPLPPHLRYSFLGSGDTLPVILSAHLIDVQVEHVLRKLRDRIRALGWSITYIRGISSSYCMHKILLEEDSKPSVEFQRRLNPIMEEVVKKEIMISLEDQEKTTFKVPYSMYFPALHDGYFHRYGGKLYGEGIVLGHKISSEGIEVHKVKIEAIEKLPPPVSVWGVRSFLGHVGFYRRFIKYFSKVANPMCKLLEKDVKFVFNKACLTTFDELKKRLVSAPIIIAPDWSLSFILMCDASDFAMGAVLGQKRDKIFSSYLLCQQDT